MSVTSMHKVYLEICQWKNAENQSVFTEVMTKTQSGYFLNTMYK